MGIFKSTKKLIRSLELTDLMADTTPRQRDSVKRNKNIFVIMLSRFTAFAPLTVSYQAKLCRGSASHCKSALRVGRVRVAIGTSDEG